jgi:formylglycine-generating enzyme required for sulfatase activity
MDMAGNAWEWMENWYGKGQDDRALRGGSWGLPSENLRCVARYLGIPLSNWSINGFRVVCEFAPSHTSR